MTEPSGGPAPTPPSPGVPGPRVVAGLALVLLAVGGLYALGLALAPDVPPQGTARSILERLHRSQEAFSDRDLDGDGLKDVARSLGELQAAGLIDRDLARGRVRGYLFALSPSTTEPATRWCATATPVDAAVPGHERWLMINHAGAVFYTTAGPLEPDPASCEPPPGALRW